jgi:large subunit ribosomal protein L23
MASTKEATRTRGPQLEPHQIILRPLITEKGTHQSQHHSEKRKVWAPAYSFEVNPWATKDEIKAAVEDLFGVQVAKVRTQNRQGKQRRFRFRMGRLAHWKKAVVTLKPDSPAIEFF